MPRAVEEWIGKTDDSRPPARVKLRILAKHENRCYLTGRLFRDGDAPDIQFDHIVALINGGENRESNLAPVHRAPHKEKTKRDLAEKSKTAKRRASQFVKKDRPKRVWPKGRKIARRANPWG